MSRIAIFPGSFDPFTKGHKAIVDRALPLFDKLVIAIGINSSKKPFLSIEERLANIRKLFKTEERVEVVVYETLTMDLADKFGAKYILRGVRSATDFEYEKNIAEANKRIAGLETIFIISDPEMSYISSSLVRELVSFGRDVSSLLP